MKSLDLFIGIKAEQSLRDVVKNLSESDSTESSEIELYPVGKKDWVAGIRIKEGISFFSLKEHHSEALRKLISLGSQQRIRQESLRVYSVRPPVPVFRDPTDEQDAENTSSRKANSSLIAADGTAICPNCGTEVHKFNLLFGPRETIIGCYLCRGDRR